MSFEFDEDFDKRLLAGSGIALASYAVAGTAAPAKLHEVYMERTELCHEPTMRWFGLAIGNAAAHQLVISASEPNTKVLKNGLKVAGASWLDKVHKADVGFASAAAQAAFGALCLWRGFANGD
ncbi:cytochrome C [Chlorella sorokiniana]|uniref:Cytochrome C n=1 Tax=Chlorella sorokiniana TaxID=3076 RepID=A0A2P6TCD5_CHLSO|nr:cytochrome C [Chlorella sorokiniana]|eukprot:PRW20295.1 cytochrome C [Chlorella sorokiniana]